VRKPTIEYTAEDYSTVMTTNLDSAFHLCQLAYPLLKESGNGSVVFISSVASLISVGTGSIYAMSKGNLMYYRVFFCTMDTNYFDRHLLKRFAVLFSSAAINQLTKNLACEWAKDNIRSNCVAPWYTKTSLVEQVMLFSHL
jgi:tropinone reductase I